MKIMDWIEDLMTRRSRARRELIIATRQGGDALAILGLTWGDTVLYEVYNSMHNSREPVVRQTFDEVLRYTFPRGQMNPYQARLRRQAEENHQAIMYRFEPATGYGPDTARAPKTDLEALAVERLAGLGTERGAALAMEIERGRERRRGLH
jgi:hypothetical protein